MEYRKVVAIILLIMGAMIFSSSGLAQDDPKDTYYMYVNWNPGINYTTGINGYVDNHGYLGDAGEEYVFVVGGPDYTGHHTAYVYRVDTDGDPNMHPSNPDATGPIATRTFTLINSHYLGYYRAGHENAFYIDDSGIYYGASPGWSGSAAPGWGGIFHWDFDWNEIGWEVPVPVARAQTLARNPNTGEWWIGDTDRRLFRWDGSAWVYMFTHPNMSGGHHDGMEIIGNILSVSDMTSDVIYQYRLDASGNPIDPPASPFKIFTYSAGPPVEGMGYGPNRHIWIAGYGSGTIYEIGGGGLIRDIEDQIKKSGELFDSFDLDDYTQDLLEPVTWTYAGNIVLSVAVDGDNMVTITYPDGWTGSETIIFTATGDDGTVIADDATFTVLPALEALCVVIPDTMYMYYAYALDPMIGTIYLGNLPPTHTVNDINTSTLAINSEIDPTSVTLLSEFPGFDDQVLALEFSITDFLFSYTSVWDMEDHPFTVSGECSDGAHLVAEGVVTIIGHISGDANGDGAVDIGDAVYLINYVFNDGQPPPFMDSGDANCDGRVDIGDAVYLVRYLFFHGPEPCHP